MRKKNMALRKKNKEILKKYIATHKKDMEELKIYIAKIKEDLAMGRIDMETQKMIFATRKFGKT